MRKRNRKLNIQNSKNVMYLNVNWCIISLFFFLNKRKIMIRLKIHSVKSNICVIIQNLGIFRNVSTFPYALLSYKRKNVQKSSKNKEISHRREWKKCKILKTEWFLNTQWVLLIHLVWSLLYKIIFNIILEIFIYIWTNQIIFIQFIWIYKIIR